MRLGSERSAVTLWWLMVVASRQEPTLPGEPRITKRLGTQAHKQQRDYQQVTISENMCNYALTHRTTNNQQQRTTITTITATKLGDDHGFITHHGFTMHHWGPKGCYGHVRGHGWRVGGCGGVSTNVFVSSHIVESQSKCINTHTHIYLYICNVI